MQDATALPQLLQAVEHLAELANRQGAVIDRLLRAQEDREEVAPALLKDYREQLATVAHQRASLDVLVRRFWQALGQEGAQ